MVEPRESGAVKAHAGRVPTRYVLLGVKEDADVG